MQIRTEHKPSARAVEVDSEDTEEDPVKEVHGVCSLAVCIDGTRGARNLWGQLDHGCESRCRGTRDHPSGLATSQRASAATRSGALA